MLFNFLFSISCFLFVVSFSTKLLFGDNPKRFHSYLYFLFLILALFSGFVQFLYFFNDSPNYNFMYFLVITVIILISVSFNLFFSKNKKTA